MPAGNAYPSGHLVRSPIVGLAVVETRFLELAMSLLDFSPRIPLGIFSILPLKNMGRMLAIEDHIELSRDQRHDDERCFCFLLGFTLIDREGRSREDYNFHNFITNVLVAISHPRTARFIPQLIRYAKACFSYECFILMAMRIFNKFVGQGLKSSVRHCYGLQGTYQTI